MLPFPVELLRFLENNTSLTSALSAVQTAADKSAADSGTGLSPEIKERLASVPEVAALEAADSGDQDRLTVGAANVQPTPAPGRSANDSGSAPFAELLAHRAFAAVVVARRGRASPLASPPCRAARDSRRSQLFAELPTIMDLRSQLPVVELVYASHEIRAQRR